MRLDIAPDTDSLARRAADWLLDVALAKDGGIAIALSGGSTPRRLYELLAEPPWCERFPWRKTHWFWGDERFVPPTDARSNFRMVNEALLSRVPVPAANVHPMPTEAVTPAAAAADYAAELQRFYGTPELDVTRPLFDVVLMGLGSDGHTASLFPGTAALDERKLWAVAVEGVQPEARVTLTYPVLESCREAAFLVAGAEKRAAFDRLRSGDKGIPAGRFMPKGRLNCFADVAAAGGTADSS
ncbi:MAG TPA: 6-phosphogluconolactonase [Gammaproteobacteria bacterium]|nr:6-phosphogluconolactonase [Gammaproteobacteria bacterium]